ncbi:aminotransferase class III-fold pyridoxal phosphate-dependent enzyme [Streptomyces zhihengii]
MKFGFLAHAVSPAHRNQMRGLDLLGRLLDDHRGTVRPPGPRLHVPLPMLTSVTSPTGDRCDGEVRGLAFTAEQILERPTAAREMVAAEVAALRDAGAEIVGLGGATSIVGDRGLWTAARSGVPVTSGNSLTAYAAHEALRRCARLLGPAAADAPVVVVGYPGSIALAVARLLLADGFRLELVVRRGRAAGGCCAGWTRRNGSGWCSSTTSPAATPPRACTSRRPPRAGSSTPAGCTPVRWSWTSPCPATRPCRPPAGTCSSWTAAWSAPTRPCASATAASPPPPSSSTAAWPRPWCSPWRARPRTGPSAGRSTWPGCAASARSPPATASCPPRSPCSAARSPTRTSPGWPPPHPAAPAGGPATTGPAAAPATTGPAAAPRPPDPPRPPPPRIGRGIRNRRRPRIGRCVRNRRPRTRRGVRVRRRGEPRRFRDHVNPPLSRLFAAHGMDRVFTRADGCVLTTADGTDYLDFVAGYGAVSLGHNHPGWWGPCAPSSTGAPPPSPSTSRCRCRPANSPNG